MMHELVIKVIYFLKKNPNPSDEQFHQWAESQGIDIHQAESAAYHLATKAAQLFTEGRSIDKKVKASDVDPKELRMGMEVEKEHITSCPMITKKIALDHLSEENMTKYYTNLKNMEDAINKKDKYLTLEY